MPGEVDQQYPPKTPSRLWALLRAAVLTVVALATALDNAQNVVHGAHQVAQVVSGHLGF